MRAHTKNVYECVQLQCCILILYRGRLVGRLGAAGGMTRARTLKKIILYLGIIIDTRILLDIRGYLGCLSTLEHTHAHSHAHTTFILCNTLYGIGMDTPIQTVITIIIIIFYTSYTDYNASVQRAPSYYVLITNFQQLFRERRSPPDH